MPELGKALIPAFAAGFAVQQLLELLDPIVEKIIPKDSKKLVLGLVALGAGLLLAIQTPIRVLQPLQLGVDVWLDRIVTALVLSAGTQGFNSIQKYASAAKEAKKADAEIKRQATPPAGGASMSRV